MKSYGSTKFSASFTVKSQKFNKILLFLFIMRRGLLVILAAVFCFGIAGAGVPGMRTEFGIVAGVNQPFVRADMGQSTAALKAKMGFTAGLQMGLRLAGVIGVQPEILYSSYRIGVTDQKQNFTTDIKCNSLQIPVLLSLRLALVRINIGPVFTVMDNPTYLDRGEEKVMFGRLYPTVSYSAGVSVCFLKKLVVDARVSSGLKSMENFLSYDAKHQGSTIKTTTINAQLKVGVLF